MKQKQLKELRTKNMQELEKILSERKVEMTKSQAEIEVKKEKNLKKLKNLRHEIAQVATILKEKQILGQKETEKKE